MARVNKKKRKWWIYLLVLLVVIQFIRPERNVATAALNADKNITAVYEVPQPVRDILKTSCNDCHSNTTIYPWYTNVQPVGWWLQWHVNEGKQHLNFDEFGSSSLRRQYHQLEETADQVNHDEMPLSSYLIIHKDAALSAAQKDQLIQWTQSIRKSMENKYPMDSLQRPQSGR
ncbi:MAG TPA: heme-binding domain-containing protein [Flavitalea sp.]|nr:heme-binding domain-containing protein [Flavitalea sp.]